MNIPNTRRAPTSATPTETDVGRSLWGGYDVPRAPRRRRDPPHGGGPQRAIRLADLFYRRPRRNDARASLWSSARRARASGRPRAARVAPTLTHESATAVCRFLSGRPDR